MLCAPIIDKSNEEIEIFCNHLREVIRPLKKTGHKFSIRILQRQSRKRQTINVTGEYGLGIRNGQRELLIKFCLQESFGIKINFFKIHPRRLYTRKSPADDGCRIIQNQIDYVLVDRKFQNSITCVETYGG